MNPRYERWRWQTFGITWLIYASFYLTRQSFSVAKVALDKDPRVTFARDGYSLVDSAAAAGKYSAVAHARSDYGLVDSAYLTTYMLGQFLFGALGDRFGPRRILLAGMALSVLAAVATGFSTTLWAFVAFAVLQGVAHATGWSNVSKVMSSWFSLNERGRVIGWWCTHYTVGSAFALFFAGWMMQRFGSVQAGAAGNTIVPYWPAAFWGPAAVLGVVLVLSWLLLRDRPEDVGLAAIETYRGEGQSLLEADDAREPLADHSWKVVGEVLSTHSVWMLAIAYFPIKLARYSFYFWGPKYVDESLGGDVDTSALTAAAMPFGGLVGVIVLGYLSDKLFQSRRIPATVLSLLATAAVIFIGMRPIESYWMMAIFFFAVGAFLFGPDSMISATASMDFGTKRGAGTATGFVNGIGSIGGILGGYLPGIMTTEDNWTPMFYVMLLGLVGSAFVLLPLWWKRPPVA